MKQFATTPQILKNAHFSQNKKHFSQEEKEKQRTESHKSRVEREFCLRNLENREEKENNF